MAKQTEVKIPKKIGNTELYKFPSKAISSKVPLISEFFHNRIHAFNQSRPDPPQTTRLVRKEQERSPLAQDLGSVRDLDFGNHAAADAGQDRSSLLRNVSQSVSDYHSIGSRSASTGPARLVRARILSPRGEFKKIRIGADAPAQRNYAPRLREFARAAGNRRLHRGRDSQYRLPENLPSR